jgi:hypothetical protein
MTSAEFKRDFYCTFYIENQNDQHLVIVSTAKNRLNNLTVDSVKTTIDIHKTTNWIVDSQSPISVNTWDWTKVIEKTKRAQLDYFVMRAPIEDFYPLSYNDNPSIEEFYQI